MIKIEKEHWLLYLLVWLFCISVFLLPPIKIASGLPSIFGTDILLPFIGIAALRRVWEFKFIIDKRIIVYTAVFISCIIISIIINKRWGVISDWFEVYKLIKFFIVVLYAAFCLPRLNLEKILRVVFIGVVIFNVLHYFDVLNFNKYIEVYYGSDIQVSTFGLNSLGLPDTKRILGTLGNPNNNALLMLFFVVYFFKPNGSKFENLYYYVAVFMVIACQSRTGLLALISVLIIAAIIYKQSARKTVTSLLITSFMYLLQFKLGNIYLNSLGNLTLIEHSFKEGRVSMWLKLFHMWKDKPILGYGSNKEYFYIRNWYPEGEYILMLWRYGIIGLSAYLLWITYPVFFVLKRLKTITENEFKVFAFTIVILIGAITNNPTADFSILMMFAMVIGSSLSCSVKTSIV